MAPLMRTTSDASAASSRRKEQEKARQQTAETFHTNKNAQASYGAQLRHLARQVARIIQAFAPETAEAPFEPGQVARIEQALAAYAEAIAPWARTTAYRMIGEVNRRNKTSWQRYTEGMGHALAREIQTAPIGAAIEQLMAEQVHLITSLPIDAAQRVHEKVLEALSLSTRYPEQTAEIKAALAEAHPYQTEQWLKNRATLIARTETARAASVLTEARAVHVGAESYIWRTAGDWKVRESHRRLNGSVHRWDEPPLSDPPDYHSHPGTIWNCRCVALPIIPE